jgi:hypothetical protein
MIKFTSTILTDYPLKTFLLNTVLKTAESTTFLGLQLDNHLTCKAHVNQLLHKLSMVGFQMQKLSYVLSINNLKSVYYAYYHFLIKYWIIYWCNIPDCHKVFLMQKKIIRMMMRVGPTHSCRDLFKKLEILPIPCVYLLSLMTFVVNNCDKFPKNNSIHTISTRRNDLFHISLSHLFSYQKGVYFSGIRLFNMLPRIILILRTEKINLGLLYEDTYKEIPSILLMNS